MFELRSSILLVNSTVASQKGVGSILNFAGKIFADRAEVFVH